MSAELPADRARLVSTDFPAVRARALRKEFGAVRAVDGVELAVAPGELRGLLGPNGAGKTTLLRMLFGLLRPDQGEIELLGHPLGPFDAPALDGVAGFVEEPRFYPYLSGRANLELLAELDGAGATEMIDARLKQVGLSERAEDRVGGYSTGMRQRLGIAAALLRRPRLLLLDEPTAGLDPAGARDVAALLRELSASGVAVLLSSHQIGEVEAVCHSFTFLRCGRVVWDGTAADLRVQAPASAFRLRTSDDRRAVQLAQRHGRVSLRHDDDALAVTAREEDLDALVLELAGAGIAVRRLELMESPLASMFFTLTRSD